MTTGRGPARGGASARILRILDGNPFPILLVSTVGALLLLVLAPSLLVADSWLTLMAGREVIDHGLPDTETITVLGEGATWTDQQWLAQVAFYGAHALGGIRAVLLADVALVLVTLALGIATARASGATARSTFLVALLAVTAGPWGWTVRAQATALPLFAAALWLLVDAARGGPRRRTLLVLPLLVVWANLHGSVVLGALLAVILGAIELARRRGGWIPPLLIATSPLCVLASPYATRLPAYYDLMLVDAPFADMLREWSWSSPSWTTFLFYLLGGLTALLLALPAARRRLTLFELVVVVVTLVGAVQAVRGVIWFALAAAAILPMAFDGLIRRADVEAPRLNRIISLGAVTGLGAAVIASHFLSSSWLLQEWPERQVRAVAAVTRDPTVRVFATDRHSDWLLWRLPSLRGRIAFDVRFELYDRETLEDIVRYNGMLGPEWQSITDGYDVVVVDARKNPRQAETLAREPGGRPTYRDADITVIVRE